MKECFGATTPDGAGARLTAPSDLRDSNRRATRGIRAVSRSDPGIAYISRKPDTAHFTRGGSRVDSHAEFAETAKFVLTQRTRRAQRAPPPSAPWRGAAPATRRSRGDRCSPLRGSIRENAAARLCRERHSSFDGVTVFRPTALPRRLLRIFASGFRAAAFAAAGQIFAKSRTKRGNAARRQSGAESRKPDIPGTGARKASSPSGPCYTAVNGIPTNGQALPPPPSRCRSIPVLRHQRKSRRATPPRVVYHLSISQKSAASRTPECRSHDLGSLCSRLKYAIGVPLKPLG